MMELGAPSVAAAPTGSAADRTHPAEEHIMAASEAHALDGVEPTATEGRGIPSESTSDGRLVAGIGVIGVPEGSRHDSRYARNGKRILDLVVAGVAIVISCPVLVGAAVAVRLTLGSPVLFRQVRVGRDGHRFEVLKFRTMKPDRRQLHLPAPEWDGTDRRLVHKTPDHPLLTPVGRFLRRYSIDELPQLFNVLRGEMSVVGPRPELPSVVADYEPWQRGRLLATPGLTGLWQITARGSGPMHEGTEHDIEYLREMSLACDLRIIAFTPKAMFGEHKGY
jgi:lipopolysaccharide/colanic/teichoic acid biosynthesis glycosyltransferase